MTLDDDICERARQARDVRFDGRFFIAVTSTRIFCRPTCPVQPPCRKNVRFYPTAASALAAGYRPCLRCLPELAPGVRATVQPGDRVAQALALIEAGYLDDHDNSALAARLGLSVRHLNRLFAQHVGVSPQQVALTRRLLFAKQLLDESELTIADIAFAAGFGSLRRFNSIVRETWQRTPGQLRRQPAASVSRPIALRLAYRPPLDWIGLLEFLHKRSVPEVEHADPERGLYRRNIHLDGESGWFELRARQDADALALTVNFPGVRSLAPLVQRVRRMFDLDADPLAVSAVLAGDPLLAEVFAATPGLRIPGAWDPFEIAVRGILGQQVSVAAARTLTRRLVQGFGAVLPASLPNGPQYLFPTPTALADANLESLGVVSSRARAIRVLAAAVAAGDVPFDDPNLITALLAIPGIGDWTAHYISLRSGHDPDAFPAADLVLRRVAGDGQALTTTALRRRADPWRPWRGYAAIALWRCATATSTSAQT